MVRLLVLMPPNISLIVYVRSEELVAMLLLCGRNLRPRLRHFEYVQFGEVYA